MIEVNNLVKEYRYTVGRNYFQQTINWLKNKKESVTVVDHVSFSIKAGEIVGLLGPNGAGKSTTIKMLTGVLQPTSGTISVLGIDPTKERKRHARNIGVVFGQRSQLWWDLPLIKSYRLLKHIYDIPAQEYNVTLHKLIDILRVDNILYKPVRQLSLGERMKGELIASLLHSPKVLFLDEPTIGLDIMTTVALHDFLLQINRELKTTIIITSHNMDDIEKLCERIILINKGKVMFDGDKHHFHTLTDIKIQIVITTESDGELNFQVASENDVPQTIKQLSEQYKIQKLEIRKPDISNVITRLLQSTGT